MQRKETGVTNELQIIEDRCQSSEDRGQMPEVRCKMLNFRNVFKADYCF